MNRINEFNKVDAVVVSYSCVMSPLNQSTEQIFSMSEELFFKVFTHISRRTNFRMLFVPRLIVNTYDVDQKIPSKIVYPASMMGNSQILNEVQQRLNMIQNPFQRGLKELSLYEDSIRQLFGVTQFQKKESDNTVKYSYQSQELIKYIQNITCGFFQYLNTLNIIQQNENVSIFSDKKNILHWRFVESTFFLQNRLYGIKNKVDFASKKNNFSQVKKEQSYFVKTLKEKEQLSISNFADKQSFDYLRELTRTFELIDYIFLFQQNVTKSSDIEKELETPQIAVKKYRIINTLNKSCYLTKNSQYYVDYKKGQVYFFNILFPCVEKISNNNSIDLMLSVCNCIGQIPQGSETKENEIQVLKICDWKFSRITLGMNDELQDQRQYFLQNATIISCSDKIFLKEQKVQTKFKFLLFFGGEINYFDKQTSEINLNQKEVIKSSCLYVLKIQDSSSSNEVIFQFEEIKMFGVSQNIIYLENNFLTNYFLLQLDQ